MKSLTPALKTHYAKGTTTLATCWKATLTNGTVVAATSLDRDLVIGGVTYQAAHGYTTSAIESSQDLNPDNLEVEGFLASPQITDADIHSGLWDYAAIELFEVNYNDPEGGKNILRTGTLGEVRGGRSKFTAELRGLMQAYTRTIVRLTTKECTAELGDTRCKKDMTGLTVTGTVDSVTRNRIINDAARTEIADWFSGGKLSFTSGANAGKSMEVKRSTPGVLELHEPMYFPIAEGDAYSVTAGCLKRFAEDCIGKHNNGVNFRGFPHLPGASVYKVGGIDYGQTDILAGESGTGGGSTGGGSTGGGSTGGGTSGGTGTAHTYTEDATTAFLNPERGFVIQSVVSESDAITTGELSGYKAAGHSLVWMQVTLNSFKTTALSSTILANIVASFNAIRSSGMKAVLRFNYTQDISGVDASKTQMLAHIAQLKPILQTHADVIAIMDAGFIGAWGEWAYSTNFGNINGAVADYALTSGQWADRKAIVDALLDALPANRCINLRTPNFKRRMYSTTALADSQRHNETAIARLSHHNDAFLSSANDMGTYLDRTTEYAYLKQETKWLPIGGESAAYDASRNSCPTAVGELADLHFSWLNRYYFGSVLDRWNTDGCLADIDRKLGYRLTLVSSEISGSVTPGGSMLVKLAIRNNGYAAPFNPRKVYLVLVNGGTTHKILLTNVDARDWLPGLNNVDVTFTLPSSVAEATYNVYLHIADGTASLETRPDYSIRLANIGLWDATNGYNNLEHTLTVAATVTPPGDTPPGEYPAMAGPNAANFGATPTFFDGFDGDTLSNRWNRGIWYGSPPPSGSWRVRNGCLEMCAVPGMPLTGDDTAYICFDTDPNSSKGATNPFEQKFGVFQIRAKLPIGRGYWPAFWLFGHPGTHRPEIDVFEAYPGGDGWSSGDTAPHPIRAASTLHPLDDPGGYQATQVSFNIANALDLSADFHTYTCEWDAGVMRFYFDGTLVRTVTNSDTLAWFAQFALYLMIDFGLGSAAGNRSSDTSVSPTGFGSDPSNPTANVYRVDYVAAWQYTKYL